MCAHFSLCLAGYKCEGRVRNMGKRMGGKAREEGESMF